MESRGRQLQREGNVAREHEQDLVKSLQKFDEALVAYLKDGDFLGASENLADKAITLRILYQQTDIREYLIYAKHIMQTSLEIARENSEKGALAMPLFNMAKVYEELDENEEAFKAIEEALTQLPDSFHFRPTVEADMKIHMYFNKYMSGDKSVLNDMIEQVKVLEEGEEEEYAKKVWLSGAYMGLAEMLLKDDPNAARNYLSKAKEIIDSDERLKLRKAQWEELSQSFS